MKGALSVFRFLADRAGRRERAALVTLTEVTGSAARALGEHMAVSESGDAIGSFSGGCVEAAVIAEAREAIAAEQARLVRFGAGSPYIDIRLPCGGGIDLLFQPEPDQAQIDRAIALLEARRPVVLGLSATGSIITDEAGAADVTRRVGSGFQVRHDPTLRLVVMGHGAEPEALIEMALAYGAEVLLLSPQASLIENARQRGVPARLLRSLGRSDTLPLDRWTAVVALFHDHDWETDLLLQSLEQEPFFIGAMGSRRTHAERRRRLMGAGGHGGKVDRVVGPIGLIQSSRDPGTLALSIMAQVVEAFDA